MTTQEPKKARKPYTKKALEQVNAKTEAYKKTLPEIKTPNEPHYTTLEPLLERVELLADRRTDKEAKALLTGISMGLKHALGKGELMERSGRFILTGTDEA